MKLFLFMVCFLFGASNSFPSKVIDGVVFESQKIQESEFIRVWRYYIPRADLSAFAKESIFGFFSEDDLISFLQFILISFKRQDSHEKLIPYISVQYLLGCEKSLSSLFNSFKELTPIPDSNVVLAYEYTVYKDEKDALSKVRILQSNAVSNLDFVKNYFRDIGEVSVSVFLCNVKKNSTFVIEYTNCYKVYYIASDPFKKKPMLNAKTIVKDYFLNIIDNVLDIDSLDLEI